MSEKTGIEAAIEAGKIIGAQELVVVEGTPFLIVPDNFKLERMEQYMATPRRIKQTVMVNTAEGFSEYYNRFATDSSCIFADIEKARFVGIIDYHSVASPGWGDHQVVLSCRRTDEWSAWVDHSGAQMSQVEFARFIEDNLEEIRSPSGAEMLEIAMTLQAKTKVNWESGIRLSDGQVQFGYAEEINGTAGAMGQLKIPEKLKLGIRVFEGDRAGYEMEARFRYRTEKGRLTMWYDLVRYHKVYRSAVRDVAMAIAKDKAGLFIEGVA